ncbi:MAG: spore coat U domain-containing protein [Allosphingosinicella sp.]|uniref:Csu type fimbrial protein n=1 Tax=Allosphingosinicella sp. TaxID=2823234 RepID=UPI0039390E71
MTDTNLKGVGRGGAMVLAATVASLGLTAPAVAQSANSSLPVSATVTANCTITTSAVSFGSVNTLSGSNVDGTGGITVTCTNGTSWSASAGAGSGTGATLASRRMTSGSNLLNYNLFTDAARTSIWGNGTSSTVALTGTGSGTAQNLTIYGRVASGQTSAPAGSYADTVSVTVSY